MTPPTAATAPVRARVRPMPPARSPVTRPTRRPRRISGPARGRGAASARAAASVQPSGLAVGVLAALRSVDGSPLLDRLIRSRIWIGLMAFALIGIVTLQLMLLKLNADVGRSLAQASSLQRENAALSIENSERAAGSLVESSASSLGMELIPPGSLRFLTPHPGSDAAHAAQLAGQQAPASAATPTGSTAAAAAAVSASPTTETSSGSQQPAPSGEAAQSATASTTPAPAPGAGGEAQQPQTQPQPAPQQTSTSSTSTGEAGATTAAPVTGTGSQAPPSGTPAGGTQAGQG